MSLTYRKLDANGDYTFGFRAGNFYKDQPEAVAQAVKTRLGLILGEWFLDVTYGTPYNSEILGAGNVGNYDFALQKVILGTPGVLRITSYASQVNPSTRGASVSCTIDTIYGSASVTQTL